MRHARDRGSGSVLAVAIVSSLAVATMALAPLCFGLASRAAVAGAADAAALAAADSAAGILSRQPCVVAGIVASANGAVLDGCVVDGRVATVRLSRPFMGFSLQASATAGPPGAVSK
jgi:secretion/DNA translocation related TadE-like protein